ncbi:MAG: bifunctional diguanylate cyclase/phosphodiesterase [Burkholderiaceae bacterium]
MGAIQEEVGAYETLVEFLYRAPIGLVQTTLAGDIEMINPMSASLLMPLAPNGDLANLFDSFDAVAPQLRQAVRDHRGPSGAVCESVRIDLRGPGSANAGGLVLSVSIVKLDANRLMCTIADVTADVRRERRGLERGLAAASRIDPLTRLPNRVAVRDLIERLMQPPRDTAMAGCAVLYLNCDRFRQVNDAHGHPVGDAVLGLMADRIRSTLRQRSRRSPIAPGTEPLAGRIGGDEFVVLLDDLDGSDDVHAVAHRLLDVLSQPYAVAGTQIHCSLSMGIVLGPQIDVAATPDAVLQDASFAMLEAKRDGRARHVVFDPAMRERAEKRSVVEAELRTALADGQLFVVFQPVVGFELDPQRGVRIDRAAGVEALVRWRHPVRGIVPPFEFIGIAEECGLIAPLGEFVLRAACRQFGLWKASLGSRAPRLLAVNLSRGQLGNDTIAATVADALRESGMQPSELQLEVTESLAAQDEVVQRRLHDLKSLGITLALDDFGTGYSSLASLHLLPVDTVKIDRSFVSQAVDSAHHRVLIEATVRVAKSLRMRTVAEGIETAAQADIVRGLGCDKGQGYHFSRPLSPDALVAWLHEAPTATPRGAEPALNGECAPFAGANLTSSSVHRPAAATG